MSAAARCISSANRAAASQDRVGAPLAQHALQVRLFSEQLGKRLRVSCLLGERHRRADPRHRGPQVASEPLHPGEQLFAVRLDLELVGLATGLRAKIADRAPLVLEDQCPRKAEERASARRTIPRDGDEVDEQAARGLRIARSQVSVGGVEAATPRILLVGRRGQSPSAVEELGRRLGCAAEQRSPGRLVQDRCALSVGSGRGEREMPGALLDVACECRQTCVELAPACGRCFRVHDRAEEWMREPNAVACDLDDPGGERLTETVGISSLSESCLDPVDRWLRKRGDDLCGLARRRLQVLEPVSHELAQALWHGKRLARHEADLTAPQRARDLQSEKGITARDAMEPQERWGR